MVSREFAPLASFYSTKKIALFHPSRSLTEQLKIWSDRCGSCRSPITFEDGWSKLCEQDYHPDFVVVDATKYPAKVSDVLERIVDAFGSECVMIYTEITHEGLETLVRRMGVPLLLGPMSISEWNDYFDHKFATIAPSY